jgi:hypothetical protein
MPVRNTETLRQTDKGVRHSLESAGRLFLSLKSGKTKTTMSHDEAGRRSHRKDYGVLIRSDG